MTGLSEFIKITLPLEKNIFSELMLSADFEHVAKGRVGNHLVRVNENGVVPIVRTTTQYTIPANSFSPIHHSIIERIKETIHDGPLASVAPLDFNNALIEVYDRNYTKMGYHSDQCMDLEAQSYIGLFSCYERPDELTAHSMRTLKIKNKETLEEFDIPLTHNSVVLFSLPTNYKFLHKIVLEPVLNQSPAKDDNKWLGITFRKSKTFIQFKDSIPSFSNGTTLEFATEDQKTEFFKLRGQENNTLNFIYPDIHYTLSMADMLEPKGRF